MFQFTNAQNRYYFLAFPHEKKLSEINYIWENGAFWEKEKFYYNELYSIQKIERLNPFDILLSTEEYKYNSENRLISITKLNNFNSPTEIKKIEYQANKKIENTFDKYNNLIEIKSFDFEDRIIEHQTFKGVEYSYKYVYEYNYENPKDYDYYIITPDNDIERKQSIKFRKNGEHSEITTFSKDSNLMTVQKFKYNLDNQILQIIKYDSKNNILEKSTFNYNKKGKLISRTSTGENNSFRDKIVYQYDKKNRLIKEIFYRSEILKPKPMFDYETIYIYDEKNNLIETNNFNSLTGKKRISEKEFYDNQRRISKKIEYYLGNISKETIYENGLENTETRYNKDGSIFDIAKYEYDKKGNLIIVTVTNSDASLKEKFGFKYDEKGNKTIIEY